MSSLDIATHLRTSAEEAGALRLINACPGLSPWSAALGAPAPSNFELTLTAPPGAVLPPDAQLLSGFIPELFAADSLEVASGGQRRVFPEIRQWLAGPATTQLGYEDLPLGANARNYVRLVGCFPDGLPMFATDADARLEYLRRRTWLGSRRFRSPGNKIIFRALVREHQHTAVEVQSLGADAGEDVWTVGAGLTKATLTSRQGRQRLTRDCVHGEIALPYAVHEELTRLLAARGLRAFELELTSAEACEWGLLGNVVLRADTRGRLGRLLDAISDDSSLLEYQIAQKLLERQRHAARLNERIDIARSAPVVTYAGTFVGLEPRSEAGAIAIFHKLEGMGALPFGFCSRAWAGADGIDELADVTLPPSGVKQPEAPVEYEFDFPNFFTHDHPVEQVKLVVAWKNTRPPLLAPTSEPWLFNYLHNSSVLPVVIMSAFPRLQIGSQT